MSLNRHNSTRRRQQRAQLARHRGDRCTYCRRPFTADLPRTLDHIVPYSLLRTWAARNLALACRPCNLAKADRLPLSMALILFASIRREEAGPVDTTVHGRGSIVHGDRSLTCVTRGVTPCVTPRLGLPVWVLLARVAYTVESTQRSTPHQPEHREQAREQSAIVGGARSTPTRLAAPDLIVHGPTVRGSTQEAVAE
ncbi:HNH endonuclease [Streptomyces uncialis]|uniref:HNH endonuclease n=1 Tax=Streptomyces uncialis TaxID=1048205 RepID=UPI00381910CB